METMCERKKDDIRNGKHISEDGERMEGWRDGGWEEEGGKEGETRKG